MLIPESRDSITGTNSSCSHLSIYCNQVKQSPSQPGNSPDLVVSYRFSFKPFLCFLSFLRPFRALAALKGETDVRDREARNTETEQEVAAAREGSFLGCSESNQKCSRDNDALKTSH